MEVGRQSPALPPAGGNVSPPVRVRLGAEKLKSTRSFFRGVRSPVEGVFHLLLPLAVGQAPTPDGDIYSQVVFSRAPSSGWSWKSTWNRMKSEHISGRNDKQHFMKGLACSRRLCLCRHMWVLGRHFFIARKKLGSFHSRVTLSGLRAPY